MSAPTARPGNATRPDTPPNAALPVGPGNEAEGDVRLVSTVDVNGYTTGALQVFCDGAWGAVCNSNFDDRDALVACRQLNFSAGVIVPQELDVLSNRIQNDAVRDHLPRCTSLHVYT